MKNKSIKKILATILLVIVTTFIFVGCKTSASTSLEQSMFIPVESKGAVYDIVYHKDTKVMYAISRGSYNQGTFTVMLNADGTPMVYEGR